MQSDVVLSLHDVSYSYGPVDVLEGIGLSLRSGEILVVTGSNGSGKSTLAKVSAGLLQPSHGTRDGESVCSFLASDVTAPSLSVSRWVRGLGGDLRVVQNALAAMSFRGNPSSTCSALSFGNWRKLLLACVLSQPNRLLVLDEIIAGMDEAGVNGASLLVDAAADSGKGVLIVDQFSAATHLAPFPRSVLSDGKLVTA